MITLQNCTGCKVEHFRWHVVNLFWLFGSLTNGVKLADRAFILSTLLGRDGSAVSC
jgi:hypothetical protein